MNIELNFSARVSTITAWPLQEACHGISGLSRDMNISIIGNKENVTFDIEEDTRSGKLRAAKVVGTIHFVAFFS